MAAAGSVSLSLLADIFFRGHVAGGCWLAGLSLPFMFYQIEILVFSHVIYLYYDMSITCISIDYLLVFLIEFVQGC